MTCFLFEVKKMRAEISVPDHYCIASETVWSLSYDLFFVLSLTPLHARESDPSRKTQRKISFKMSVLRPSETASGSIFTCADGRAGRGGGYRVYVLKTQTALFSFCLLINRQVVVLPSEYKNTHTIHPFRCAKKNRQKGEGGGNCVYVLETQTAMFSLCVCLLIDK